MKKNILLISNLQVAVGSEDILKGINLAVESGQIHAIMGPNGAGKTTLAMSLMGHPGYKIKNQSASWRTKVKINREEILILTPEDRARKGLFVSFQHPIEVGGVSLLAFLRTAYKALNSSEKIPLSEFKNRVKEALKVVGLDESFMQRSINENFSGGEKKRAEVAQLLVLKPKFAVLDEVDSGLDVDSLKTVARAIRFAVEKFGTGVILITHYSRILHYLKPDLVHILVEGKIKKSDGMSLVKRIERDGYATV